MQITEGADSKSKVRHAVDYKGLFCIVRRVRYEADGEKYTLIFVAHVDSGKKYISSIGNGAVLIVKILIEIRIASAMTAAALQSLGRAFNSG